MTILTISLGTLLLATGAYIAWPSKPEPSYQGKKLSEWLPGYNASATPFEHAQTEDAIRRIGTNGLPFLLEWINYEEMGLKAELRAGYNRLRDKLGADRFFLGDPKRVRADLATAAITTLGPEAKGAIPILSRMLNDEEAFQRSARAAHALAHMGTNGLPPLLRAITNTNIDALGPRLHAAGSIRFLGTNALPALPALVQCLTVSGPFGVAETAAFSLGELRLEPERVVPALVVSVNGTNGQLRLHAVNALGKFGPSARPAVPALLTTLTDSWLAMRNAATNALIRIAPEAITNATTPF
jgi:hypothetical protein